MFRRSISVGINFITVWKSRLHCGWPEKKLLIHRETFPHEIVLYKLKTSLFHVQRFLLITNSTFFSKKKKTLQVILNRQVTKMKKKNYLRARCTPVIPERKSLCTFLEPFEVKRKKAKICSQEVFAHVIIAKFNNGLEIYPVGLLYCGNQSDWKKTVEFYPFRCTLHRDYLICSWSL